MAASAGPRPGWSRRAQYGLFFSFLAVVAGLIVGLFLLDPVAGRAAELSRRCAARARRHRADHRRAERGHRHRHRAWSAAPAIIGTPRTRTASSSASARRCCGGWSRPRRSSQENRQLKARAAACASAAATPSPTGRIVGSSFSSPRRFAILSVGTSDGVAVGMPVRAADGLIGRVIDAGALASPRPAGLRPRQHRPGAAAARRACR